MACLSEITEDLKHQLRVISIFAVLMFAFDAFDLVYFLKSGEIVVVAIKAFCLGFWGFVFLGRFNRLKELS